MNVGANFFIYPIIISWAPACAKSRSCSMNSNKESKEENQPLKKADEGNFNSRREIQQSEGDPSVLGR